MLDTRTVIELARAWHGLDVNAQSAERIANELAFLSEAIRPLVDELTLDDRPGKLERLLRDARMKR